MHRINKRNLIFRHKIKQSKIFRKLDDEPRPLKAVEARGLTVTPGGVITIPGSVEGWGKCGGPRQE
jgi:hypothetical protein